MNRESSTIRAFCWSGFAPELRDDAEGWRRTTEAYPDGVGPTLAEFLDGLSGVEAKGLHEQVPADSDLDDADVLVAWGHGCENWCWDERAGLIDRVTSGSLALVAMHSIWNSTEWPHIHDLIGARCNLEHVREDVPIRVRRTDVIHPVTEGVEDFEFVDEIYIPPLTLTPDVNLLLNGEWEGHVSPYAWTREPVDGRVVYIQPGHETEAVYKLPPLQRLIENSVRWCAGG
jgi:trehalose utilization protein